MLGIGETNTTKYLGDWRELPVQQHHLRFKIEDEEV